jgi:hypothetical protein
MRIKPILLGAYCGFDRNSNPVVGKIIFERVKDKAAQEEKILETDINPIFYQHLYAQRIPVGGVLPHTSLELSPSYNYDAIMLFLKGDYYGFFFNENGFFTPITFRLLNELGNIFFQLNTTKYKGIGRISNQENFLIAELNTNNCNFSLQINPLEKDIYKGYILSNLGNNMYCGPILLWKNNEQLREIIEGQHTFSFNRENLPIDIANKFEEHLRVASLPIRNLENRQQVPKSLNGVYAYDIEWLSGKQEKYILYLQDDFLLETTDSNYKGKAFYANGNIGLSFNSYNDIPMVGLMLVFIGNIIRQKIENKKGIFVGLDANNKPINGLVSLSLA